MFRTDRLAPSWLEERGHLVEPRYRKPEDFVVAVVLVVLKTHSREVPLDAAGDISEQDIAALRIDETVLAQDLDEPAPIAFDVSVALGLVGLLQAIPIAVVLGPRPKVHATHEAATEGTREVLPGGTDAQVIAISHFG